MANRYEQAIEGVSVVAADGVVLVDDGATTSLCEETAWDAAAEKLGAREALEGGDCGAEAYGQLCSEICAGSAVASIDGGSCHGDPAAQTDLVRRAGR